MKYVDQTDICLGKITIPHIGLLYFKIEETTKNLNQVGRPRDLTRDLPNASLVRYHGATSLSAFKPSLWPSG